MNRLSELADREMALLSVIGSSSGPYKKKYASLRQRGVYAEYADVFAAYAGLLEDPAVAVEALKRAVFLNWHPTCEPSCFPRSHVLDDDGRRQVLAALERVAANDDLDDELRWMIPYYYVVSDSAFFELDEYPAITRFLEGDETESVPSDLTQEQFVGRGQMGAYWNSVIASDSYRDRAASGDDPTSGE